MSDQIKIFHKEYGEGIIELDRGETIIARFGTKIQECKKEDLQNRATVGSEISAKKFNDANRTIARVQSVTIQSINKAWGVFSPSKIKLFPHQLWVCQKITQDWPTRWLIADDVGLGKTIEAGLALWALKSSGRINRFLVMCPASLVKQWSERLFDMFDIRSSEYSPEMDQTNDRFWEKHNAVIASFHTLRNDKGGRWDRLVEHEGWDLIIVDEAHHLNVKERGGATKAYRLVGHLDKEEKVDSLLFFTGTPHRGKNFGFFSLLSLLRPDLFDPNKNPADQYPYLNQAVIRNNKQEVTDLNGNKLFQAPKTINLQYTYSEQEEFFYHCLENFILEGRTYSQGLSNQKGSAVGLILATMQKLAASSVAAILSALRNRKKNFQKIKTDTEDEYARNLNALKESGATEHELESVEDRTKEILDSLIKVCRDEEISIDQLIGYASEVKSESKMEVILDLIESEHSQDSILFFTEYKATQGLLVKLLRKKYGHQSVGFINGDNYLVIKDSGEEFKLSSNRRELAEQFNTGGIRFLVSTEAAGEGVDLQGNCHVLVQVDMPWNPMRLHQRVGRLNRIGQKDKVLVYNISNPETIESKIRNHLTEKINTIMRSMKEVMDTPEDLSDLILGVPNPSLFEEIYSEAIEQKPENLKDWVDIKAGQLGGKDIMETVTNLVGNASKFDFQNAIGAIPQLDLPDLQNFLKRAASNNKRRLTQNEDCISLITPEEWKKRSDRKEMKNIIFNRQSTLGKKVEENRIAVGFPVFDRALKQAENYEDCLCLVKTDSKFKPLAIIRVFNRITTENESVSSYIYGLELNSKDLKNYKDWELLDHLNKTTFGTNFDFQGNYEKEFEKLALFEKQVNQYLKDNLHSLGQNLEHPDSELLGIIWNITS
ncbi:DEAD/DEAH box helicase [Opitutales bacterium]|nr:DEAD/DEAH box helicase [Opitutales bacterium]